MVISQRTKNYEEWKLLNERKKAKEAKRKRDMRYRPWGGMKVGVAGGFYTQWSIVTLLLFGGIAAGIVYVCYYCMSIIESYFV